MSLRDNIKQGEGLRLKAYKDSKGLPTIYYGHLIRQGEVYTGTMRDAEEYLDKDIAIATKDARDLFPDFNSFSQNRKDALVELCFNMGCQIGRKFPRFVHNVNISDWEGAANELRYADGKSVLSKWYQDVKTYRAERIIKMIEEG